MDETFLPALVTGATGFVGSAIVERLLANGRRVRVLSRRPLPELAARGCEVFVGDLENAELLKRANEGAGTVFHVAARVGVWGPSGEFFRVNVGGTERLLTVAQKAGVRRFVYTSSPSVVYTGGDLAGVDERVPLCERAPCAYPVSKARAERSVLAANCPEMRTVALRPHLIFGPGDRNLVPRVVALARAGKLRIVGSGKNRVDLTHVSNVVDAHLLAEEALARGGGAAGRAYFITNGEPVYLWAWLNELLREVGVAPLLESRKISRTSASVLGGMAEFLWAAFSLTGEPPMTRFAACELATDHWFDIGAARRDLGYAPRVSMAEGTAELVRTLR